MDNSIIEENTISQFHAYLEILRIKSNLSEVGGIKNMMQLLTTGLIQRLSKEKQALFSENDKKKIARTATMVYLQHWLENDENAKQTITSFSKEKEPGDISLRYIPINEQKRYKRNDKEQTNNAFVKSMQRAEKKYLDMRELRKAQSIQEKQPFRDDPDSTNTGKYYPFTALYFMEQYAEGKMTLYDLLTYKKGILSLTSKKDDAIIDNFIDYNRTIQETIDLIDNKDSNCIQDTAVCRKYVIACLALQELERTYRFSLFSKMAKGMQEYSWDLSQIPDIPFPWGRYIDLNENLGITFKTKEDVCIANEPYDIFNYEEIIQDIFSSNSNSTLKKIEIYREILSVSILTAMNINPLENMASWTAKDYQDAAIFFKNECDILNNVKLYIPPIEKSLQEKELFLMYMREIYSQFGNLLFMRQSLQSKRKERNLKKKKSQ